MNKLMKRALGAALSLTLAAGVLTGCSGPMAADPIKDMMGADSGITSDTVMLKVNGSDVTAGDLFFWMSQNASQVASYSQALGSEEVDWTAEAGDGQTMADYVKQNAKEQAVLYNVVAAKAMENGYEFTDEDKAAYEEELAQAKEDLGGEEAYQNWLKTSCITEEGMEKLSSVGVLFNHMKEGMFKDGSENAPSAEDLQTYATDNDLLCAKHILLMTQDTATGEAMSEEDAAAKQATAQGLLDQLKAIQDPAELESTFDTLMNENSEDTGLATNPDGYTFTAGQMVPEFEEATRALEFGQVSPELVKSDYGYHIILRLDPSKSESLRSQWATDKLNEMVDQWVEEAEVEETEAFTNLDVADFYTKLTALQESLNAAEEAAETDEAAEAETELTEEAEAAEAEAAPAEEAPAAEETPAEVEAPAEGDGQAEESEAEPAA